MPGPVCFFKQLIGYLNPLEAYAHLWNFWIYFFVLKIIWTKLIITKKLKICKTSIEKMVLNAVVTLPRQQFIYKYADSNLFTLDADIKFSNKKLNIFQASLFYYCFVLFLSFFYNNFVTQIYILNKNLNTYIENTWPKRTILCT